VAKTTIPVPRGITFEDVWAGLMENRQLLKDLAEQDAKERSKYRKEHDRLTKEIRRDLEEATRLSMENSKQIGGLHRSFGELAEHMVAPGIIKHFNEKGLYFGSVSSCGLIIYEDGKVKTEVDILVENADFLIAVEVKSKPKEEDIEHHLRRLEIVREYRSKYHDTRKIHGAIAGAIFTQRVKKLTLKAGLYVLEQPGDTMKVDVPEGFVPLNI
jgi:Holliday junction resolvase-like predicted endonuclease